MLLSKQFVADLAYSVRKEAFATWVDERIEARNKRVNTEKTSQVVMTEAAAKAFLDSSFVSKQRGVSVNLLKEANKRRKTKLEVEEQAQRVEEEQDRIAKVEEQLDKLIKANQQMERKVREAKFASDLVGKLAEDGVLVLEGSKVRVNVVQQPIELERDHEALGRMLEPVRDMPEGEQ